jgi:uncharacterized cupredoxin-like copper-binding protein
MPVGKADQSTPQGSSLKRSKAYQMKLIIFTPCAVLFALASLPAAAGSSPAADSHDAAGFSAGESGDAKKPSRIIQVTMQERDGKMLFAPDRVEIRKG